MTVAVTLGVAVAVAVAVALAVALAVAVPVAVAVIVAVAVAEAVALALAVAVAVALAAADALSGIRDVRCLNIACARYLSSLNHSRVIWNTGSQVSKHCVRTVLEQLGPFSCHQELGMPGL